MRLLNLFYIFLFYLPLTYLRVTPGVRVPQVEFHWCKELIPSHCSIKWKLNVERSGDVYEMYYAGSWFESQCLSQVTKWPSLFAPLGPSVVLLPSDAPSRVALINLRRAGGTEVSETFLSVTKVRWHMLSHRQSLYTFRCRTFWLAE